MFDNLSDKLEKALHNLKGHGKITEINVAETLKAHYPTTWSVDGENRKR